jgi:hypothetical protein
VTEPRSRRSGAIEISVVVAAALVGRLRTVGTFETIDEIHWMRRSVVFSDALVHFHPSKASVTGAPNLFGGTLATMPGVPTMWLGTLARLVWGAGRSLGVVDSGRTFNDSRSGLLLAQAAVAVATSLLIGLVVWLVRHWSSSRAGLIAGLLLATEPFWVAHGSVIHTDELTALFGLTGLLALGLVLGVPRVHERFLHNRWLALLAGFLLVCSPLTKISGLSYAPGALVIVVWAAVRALRARPDGATTWSALRPLGTVLGLGAIVAVVTVVVLWPAAWADPVTQYRQVRESVSIGYGHRPTFFLGDIRPPGIPSFYAVALPFRMTPWMLLGLAVGLPVALARRVTRLHALVLLVAALPVWITLSTARQQVDRYGLLVLGPLVVIAGLATHPGATESARTTTAVRWAVIGGGLLATLHAAVVAPWGLAYYNPVLGGGAAAERNVPVGWQEGQELASRRMAELEHGQCHGVTYHGLNFFLPRAHACGQWIKDAASATYEALYVTDRQITPPRRLKALTKGRELVAVVRIRDIDYVELWRRRRP